VDAFSAYFDGELSPEEKAAVDHHLSTCIQCRTSLERFRRTLGALGSLKRTAAPHSFLADIRQQINRRSRGRFFGRRWLLFGRIPFEWLSLAMIVAMLVYYIVVLQSSPTGVKPVP
jgi:Predicted transmembrane transcriptional regulator (anti-sigma factor)